MNISSTIVRRLAGTLAVAAALGAFGTGSALADPQSHFYVHQPEILAGLNPSPEGRPAPRPEILGGIASSVSAAPSTPVAHGGFDWTDAGIGAAVALAGAALASGGALALRKRVSLAH
jgi:hypothetical protein